jgi:hypothetical protein
MASGTADPQRDLGGAIVQSIFGALLTAGDAKAASAMIAASGTHVSNSVETQLTKSFAGARRSRSNTRSTRARSPLRPRPRSGKATTGPTPPGSFAVLVGAVIVYFFLPRVERERSLLAE